MSAGFTPRIRTVLLFFNLILIVLMTSAGIAVTRWVGEALVIRQTELILLSQGMVLSQVILDRIEEDFGHGFSRLGEVLPLKAHRPKLTREENETLTRDPVQARLDPFFSQPLEVREGWERADVPRPDDRLLTIGRDVSSLLLAARESTLTGIRVVDWRGTVIGSTSGGVGRSLAHWPEVAFALKGQAASRMYRRPQTMEIGNEANRRPYRIHVAMPLIRNQRCLGAVILVREPLSLAATMFRSLRNYMVLGTAVLLIVVVFFSVITALTISLPVGALLNRIERFAKGDRDGLQPLQRPITREIDRLSSGFVRMGRALEDRTDYILTFARELSHAFKPSLATIRLRLEFLEDESEEELPPEERSRHLSIIADETARLERKTNRALEWARADARQPTGATANVNRVVRKVAEHYRTLNFQLGLDLDPKGARAAIADEDLEKILTNLVDNSIQHGGPEVAVSLGTRLFEDGEVVVEVADNGPGISEANKAKVFNTFFTTAHANGGTGLGLSIVRSLLKAHGGSVSIESRPEFQTVFVIRLPRD